MGSKDLCKLQIGSSDLGTYALHSRSYSILHILYSILMYNYNRQSIDIAYTVYTIGFMPHTGSP